MSSVLYIHYPVYIHIVQLLILCGMKMLGKRLFIHPCSGPNKIKVLRSHKSFSPMFWHAGKCLQMPVKGGQFWSQSMINPWVNNLKTDKFIFYIKLVSNKNSMSTVIMFPNHEYVNLRNGPSLPRPSFEWRLPSSMAFQEKLTKELSLAWHLPQ